MDPKDIEKLAKILRDQGDKLLTCEFKFTLTGWCEVFDFMTQQTERPLLFFRRSFEELE